jgi:hypothetical protein
MVSGNNVALAHVSAFQVSTPLPAQTSWGTVQQEKVLENNQFVKANCFNDSIVLLMHIKHLRKGHG